MKIMIFAPHNDDEVLGVGGTIDRLVKEGHEVHICEVTRGANYIAIQEEARAAHKLLGIKDSHFLNLPVNQLSNMDQTVLNKAISEIIKKVQPVVVFVPHFGDMHSDHSAVVNSVMVAVRPKDANTVKKVLAYETLSETEWNVPSVNNTFIPNVWIDISDNINNKIKAMKCYNSQLKEFPNPRSVDAIIALSKYRGSTINVNNGEAFMLIRAII